MATKGGVNKPTKHVAKTMLKAKRSASGTRKAALLFVKAPVSVRKLRPDKIRIGILHGKDFDPVKVGTQDRHYPEKLKIKNNILPSAPGWGGQFHIDINAGLKIARLHPDVFEVHFYTGKQITPANLKKNHINFNFWYDPMVARRDGVLSKNPKLARSVESCYQDPACRVWTSWDLIQWIAYKPHYMRQLEAAGVPIIPTIFIDNGFRPHEVLKKVRARGWDNFFVKVGFAAFFGEGAIHGSTQDFVEHPEKLETFAEENKHHDCFLVQPYMFKPNGDVFDEIRNYIVNGVWQTGIFTHGTDMSKAGYYAQPPGKLLDAVRELSLKAYDEVKKIAKWHGRPINTLLSRIDVGIIPDRSTKLGFKIFINEIEPESATWLARYWPFDMATVLGPAAVDKARELLEISLSSGHRVPKAAMVRQRLRLLEDRLGPLK
jgi:hypothetical protein